MTPTDKGRNFPPLVVAANTGARIRRGKTAERASNEDGGDFHGSVHGTHDRAAGNVYGKRPYA